MSDQKKSAALLLTSNSDGSTGITLVAQGTDGTEVSVRVVTGHLEIVDTRSSTTPRD